MDVMKTVAELREERARLDEAIISLEKLLLTRAPRRGRPPAWSRMTSLTVPQGGNGQGASTHGVALSPPQD
jgi:hypothetical protein